jgi:flagellar L-ring protein FlgH
MRSSKKLPLVIVLSSAAAGLAQTAPAQQEPPREKQRQNLPSLPANNSSAQQAGVMMRQTHGSLLQAQLASRPNPAQVKPDQVSFFAVSEPVPRTLKVHDLVTIVVSEQSAITSKGTNTMSRDSEFDAKVNAFVQLQLAHLTLKGLPQSGQTPEVNLSGTRSFQGQGEVDRSDSFTARITAEVVDVKPNGTMVLQARKRIKTDEEEQSFVLTGICRVDDVAADNSILSTQLFDLELQKNHKGDVRNATRRGILGKLLDAIGSF